MIVRLEYRLKLLARNPSNRSCRRQGLTIILAARHRNVGSPEGSVVFGFSGLVATIDEKTD